MSDGTVEQRFWHENGRISFQAFLQRDKTEGEHRQWSSEGRMYVCQYYRNGGLVDGEFTSKKKQAILHMKTRLYYRCFHSAIESHVITDLVKIILAA